MASRLTDIERPAKRYNNTQTSDTCEEYIGMLHDRRLASGPKLSTIFLIALMFCVSSFLFSFLGIFNHQTISRINILATVTPQEVGGHFLFGYIVALPARNLRIGLLTGLMALALDADHLLNASGFQIQGRASHSISFAILASILIGVLARQIFPENLLKSKGKITTAEVATSSRNIGEINSVNHYDAYNLLTKRKIFFQFLIISLAAYISHIAYDVFADTRASFPMLAPFNFDDFLIPQIYALPIEGSAVLLVYVWYVASNKSTRLD